MKILKIAIAVLVVALGVVAIAAPIANMPGFLIGGSAADVPTFWGDTLPIEEIHLQIGSGPVGRT